MIAPEWVRLMARYNSWQNRSLYREANRLSAAERQADRGAFWRSIEGTLSHLAWGDMIWMSRLDGGPGPDVAIRDSSRAFDWAALMVVRPALDDRISAWAGSVSQADLDGELTWYSGAVGRQMSKPKALCIMQIFNHQTHHRGQVHAMLTAAGAKPDDTDLPFMPDELPEWSGMS